MVDLQGRVAGGLNKNQQVDIFQRLSGIVLPRGLKKTTKVRNSSLLREMWRAAASLELLPVHTRTELGEALLRRIRANDFRDSELWCLSRLGARKLLYAPMNQVLSGAVAARWAEALLKLVPEFTGAAEAVATLARQTGDTTRDVPPATYEMVRRTLESKPDSARLIAILEGEEAAEQAFGRMFGEELPSGLVLGSAGSPAIC